LEYPFLEALANHFHRLFSLCSKKIENFLNKKKAVLSGISNSTGEDFKFNEG
jgi:hypothetical protein